MRRAHLLSAAVIVVFLGAPTAADAREPLETIVQDDALVLHRSEEDVRETLGRLRALGVDRVRVTAGWSELAPGASDAKRPTFDATDPAAYEQWRWRSLDRLVVLAPRYGLETMIDIAFWAPRWATTGHRGSRPRTRVDPEAFAEFATAVARRYSGHFIPVLDPLRTRSTVGRAFSSSGSPSPVPAVKVFTLWNEPNHQAFLQPQWRRKRGRGGGWLPASPHLYRSMVASAYPAVKRITPDARVLIGATAAHGAYRNPRKGGVPPLRFLRELACVGRGMRPLRRAECRTFQTVPGDGWSHHPYSLTTLPDAVSAPRRPDDAQIGDLDALVGLLDRLASAGRIVPELRDVYVTEYGYETAAAHRPRAERLTVGDQARLLTWAEYLAWRQPRVKSWAQFLLRDIPVSRRNARSTRRGEGEWQSGLMYHDGRPKLAYDSFAVGLHVERRGDRLLMWGRARPGEEWRATIEERPPGEGWRVLSTSAPGATRLEPAFMSLQDGSFQRTARASAAGARYRTRVTAGLDARLSPSVAPVDR